jgi:long-chain acyl-CoA synthetase
VVATIADLASHAARRFGGREAVRFADGSMLSFEELDRLAGRFAGGLAAQGVRAGDRVILHLPNSCEWIIVYHAIARLGAVVVPANILLSAEEIGFIANDAGARLAVIGADRAAACPSGTQAVLVGGDRGTLFDSLLQSPEGGRAACRPDDLFSIGYTSGTSGRPKGAMLTHGNIATSVAMTATIHVRTGHDRVYSALPFPHVYGNVVLHAGFLTGAHLTATSRFEAGAALRAIGKERITLFEGVPTMYYQMLAHPELGAANFTSLVRCTVGGQTMPLDKLEAVTERFGCPLLELWGMTELAGPAISHSPYWPPRLGTIGRPFPGVEVRIADLADEEADVPTGEAGELLVRGPLTTIGYWNDPEATARAFRPGGWFATGDIGRADASGYIEIVDRRKDMILTSGYNVYPAEIERALSLHPAVSMVAVAGIPDEEKGEIAIAHVVLRTGSAVNADELIQHARKHLALYKIPRRITFTDALPTTSTGKIMRRALAKA